MYLPVFKADKEGEQVGGPGERDGHKVGLGSACPGVGVRSRASSWLILGRKKKKNKSLSLMPGAARGGEGLRSEGYELLLRYYQALLGRCFSCM